MKFCTNCKHMNGNNLCSFPVNNDDVKDVVIGAPLKLAQPPWFMRSSEAYCGGAGKWFDYKYPAHSNSGPGLQHFCGDQNCPICGGQ